jgi:hypothetical protein
MKKTGKSSLKQYLVSAEVTISVYTRVVASTKREARKIASELPLPEIYERPSGVEWRTSGELDGEPMIVSVEEE